MFPRVISVPGKSFFAGEYLALKGGESLVATSNPRFQLQVIPGTGQVEGIHQDSPAGKLIRKESDFFKNWDLRFVDPRAGAGGWGASTAQFLAVYSLQAGSELSVSNLLMSYWNYAWTGQGLRPSGADLLAQYKGSLCCFHPEFKQLSAFHWNFTDIDFALIPTGRKLATHDHLRGLEDFDERVLAAAMKEVVQSLKSGVSQDFVAGIKLYAQGLSQLGFVASHTQELLRELREKRGVLAAKGCGAMGADVILIIYDKTYQKDFVDYGGAASLSHGLELQAGG